MKALIWDNKKREYTKEVELPKGKYIAFTDNMDEPCTCANCGETVRFGEMYTSRKYYGCNGIFAFYVCSKCYEVEE
ncbi:MAG: hypothetical protein MJZ26_12155 [Fibrobacter sp.]|nr:hypothetical protein [Fibrobacter sp.]